ncbi:hypothetical protein M409DRAFT_53125 [Zasmidium cellare ATCC 36951]|uniref:SnoaL-like domain-containing protein n=1 Tax=Zasmidium cellare ATCC 36951 TaxID=1080233 RepID=A0A6A6CSK0_ZASCE|nr:uncharacterized protein M409DRAFT_53125 [Zasmidium cellare ATCC 36951]KAF2168446.1 hypothetical protein M409DRAFT_53125 [Zasmidium cellare ATCC 36951]
MASPIKALNTNHLTPHEAISDPLIRNALGIDTNNKTLMTSAFTPDAVQDMTALAFLDSHFGTTHGRDAIVSMASSTVGRMDTTHMLSNFRTSISDNGFTGTVTCYALAQHWRPGQGRSFAFESRFLMGNQYEGEVVRDESEGQGVWRLRKLVIRTMWTEGDFGVFDPASWG